MPRQPARKRALDAEEEDDDQDVLTVHADIEGEEEDEDDADFFPSDMPPSDAEDEEEEDEDEAGAEGKAAARDSDDNVDELTAEQIARLEVAGEPGQEDGDSDSEAGSGADSEADSQADSEEEEEALLKEAWAEDSDEEEEESEEEESKEVTASAAVVKRGGVKRSGGDGAGAADVAAVSSRAVRLEGQDEEAVAAAAAAELRPTGSTKRVHGAVTIGLLPLRRAALPPAIDAGGKAKPNAKAGAVMEVYSSDSDTSDDEHARNTVGRIPLEWYDDYEHVGYDLDGRKIKKTHKKRDRIEAFLNKVDNEDYARTVYDPVTGKEIVLSDEDIALIKRIQGGQFPDNAVDPYEDYVDFFTDVPLKTPVIDIPEPKRRFVPSKWEHKKVMKLVRAIRMGRLKLGKTKKEEEIVYDLWDEGQEELKRHLPASMHLPPPKPTLPGHAESYNPPPEYLPTKEEAEEWKTAHPEDRERDFLPQKFSSLRHVPGYDRFVNERFHRCLDLYLCPRARRVRNHVDPESLLPKLPDPRDLQPFPTAVSISYVGHTAAVTCLSCDPSGQWLATGSDDRTVRVWEVATGRCMKVLPCRDVVNAVQWSPNPAVSLLAVAVGARLLLVNPEVAPAAICAATDSLCKGPATQPETESAKAVTWAKSTVKQNDAGVRLVITHAREIRQLAWHYKGNYLAAVLPGTSPDAVCIHSLAKQQTQLPFKKKTRDVQRVLFHPRQPIFFVATKTQVRVYNLQTQTLVKRLRTGVKWLSSMAVHPGGDNLIVGSFDRRLAWFDLDLSPAPYKTLRYHSFALRQVSFHNSYPLFASCSDDGSIHIMHGMVYNDLLQNPLIVPVKILKGHEQTEAGLGVMDCQFHPRQPWLFSAGADGRVLLYT